MSKTTCNVPPPGWRCTRDAGHDGPCAAIPVQKAMTQAVLEVLQTAFDLNPTEIERLVNLTIPLDVKLGESLFNFAESSVLDLINIILLKAGQTIIAAKYDETGRVVGFQEYTCEAPRDK